MSERETSADVRVLVVDDEPLARAGLRAILREEHDLAVVGESGCGAEAIAAIDALSPDLVFMDIALPDLDGFDVIERLPVSRRPAIVFVTAHSDQALRAFEARALDYVTKPIRRERVREAVARARERIRLERLDRQPAPMPAAAADGPLALKVEGRLQLIDQLSIDWVEADDDHVVVHAGDRTWWSTPVTGRGVPAKRYGRSRLVSIPRDSCRSTARRSLGWPPCVSCSRGFTGTTWRFCTRARSSG